MNKSMSVQIMAGAFGLSFGLSFLKLINTIDLPWTLIWFPVYAPILSLALVLLLLTVVMLGFKILALSHGNK
jgi:hypothetical protein